VVSRFFRLVCGLCILALAAACGGGGTSTDNKTYTIRYVSLFPETDPHAVAQFKFKELVEQRSNGRIKVQVYYGQQYANGDNTAQVSQVKLGVIEMADSSPATLSTYDPNWGVLALPFLFNDDKGALTALNGPGGKILGDSIYNLVTGGFKLLGWQVIGLRNIATAKSPIRTLADLKGKKMRVIASDVNLATYRALGANPVGLSFSEVPSAMTQGVIDGLDIPAVPYVSFQSYTYAPYYTVTGTTFEVAPVIMNRGFWDSLPADLQKIVSAAVLESSDIQNTTTIGLETGALDTARSKGATVITLDPAEQAKFRSAVVSVHDTWKAKFGPKILDALESAK
jgi:tripartite ATP-independent transporter DctP family solute receptor